MRYGGRLNEKALMCGNSVVKEIQIFYLPSWQRWLDVAGKHVHGGLMFAEEKQLVMPSFISTRQEIAVYWENCRLIFNMAHPESVIERNGDDFLRESSQIEIFLGDRCIRLANKIKFIDQ